MDLSEEQLEDIVERAVKKALDKQRQQDEDDEEEYWRCGDSGF